MVPENKTKPRERRLLILESELEKILKSASQLPIPNHGLCVGGFAADIVQDVEYGTTVGKCPRCDTPAIWTGKTWDPIDFASDYSPGK